MTTATSAPSCPSCRRSSTAMYVAPPTCSAPQTARPACNGAGCSSPAASWLPPERLVVAQAVARHLAVRSGDSDVLSSIGLTRGERWIAATLSVAPALAAGIVIGATLAVGLSPLFPLGLPRRADPDVGLHADSGRSSPSVSLLSSVFVGAATASAVWRWLHTRARPGRRAAGHGRTAGFCARIAPGRADRLTSRPRGRPRPAPHARRTDPRRARGDDGCGGRHR